MRFKHTVITLSTAGILLSGYLGASFCPAGDQQSTPASPVINEARSRSVVVEDVTLSSGKQAPAYPGSIQAARETRLAFRVGGPLIRVNVKPGDRVKKGQILMEIDPTDFRDSIEILEAQLEGALAREDNARKDLERLTGLFHEKVIPQSDYDHAGSAYKAARATGRQLKAEIATARHQLSYATLEAPYDGIIISQLAENHEMVSPGQPVIGLHDVSMLEITVNVPENDIRNHSMTRGETGHVSFPGVENRSFPATLSEWSSQADRTTKTYAVTFIMPAPEEFRILPGMTAQVTWDNPVTSRQGITIPSSAVISDNGRDAVVWVLDPSTGEAARTPVTLGRFTGTSRVAVRQGLNPGDRIVTRGMDFIVPGMKLVGIDQQAGTATGTN